MIFHYQFLFKLGNDNFQRENLVLLSFTTLSQNEDYHRYSNARVPFLREGNFEGQAFPFEFKFRNTEIQIGIEYKYQSRNTWTFWEQQYQTFRLQYMETRL